MVSISSLITTTTTTNRNHDSELPPTFYCDIHNADDAEKIAYIHHKPDIHQLHISKKGSTFNDDEEVHRPPLSDTSRSCNINGRPGIVFLPGFNSKMRSTKSKALFNYCRQTNREFTTLDYYGHGESSGGGDGDTGPGGTIERWTNDVLMVLNHVKPSSKQIFVGSSMGSWIMILLYNILSSSKPSLSPSYRYTSASANKNEYNMMISGLVGLASAPDFTKILSEQINMNTKLLNQMNQLGYCDISTRYDHGGFYRIYKELLLDGEKHFLLPQKTIISSTTEIAIDKKSQSPLKNYQQLARKHIVDVPLVLIHGLEDEDINWKYSEQLLQCIDCSKEKKLILRKNGDHRLSSQEDIDVMLKVIEELL